MLNVPSKRSVLESDSDIGAMSTSACSSSKGRVEIRVLKVVASRCTETEENREIAGTEVVDEETFELQNRAFQVTFLCVFQRLPSLLFQSYKSATLVTLRAYWCMGTSWFHISRGNYCNPTNIRLC